MNESEAPELRYRSMDAWPSLAWLATCRPGQSTVEVWHGTGVETGPGWFCEAIWDGRYESGDFDRTDAVFGSGGRARASGVVFVSAATVLDRLHSISVDGQTFVSNSLVCLLSAVGGSVDPTYAHYFDDLTSIVRGYADYKRTLATSAGNVELTYYDNLRWDGDSLAREGKPRPARDFSSFERYCAFLNATLARLAENLSSPARARPYEMLGTISSGYDSATVAALARQYGLREAISFEQARSGEGDSGQEIAEILGVHLHPAARDAWRNAALPEVPFITADAKGEDVLFKGVESRLGGKALLLGYSGDVMWGKKASAAQATMARKDTSGLSLTEYRLSAGFINCAIALLGHTQSADLGALSNSPEMARWDVPGDYSRPICRRILEEAGVPRDSFGMRKRAASVLFFEQGSFLTPASEADYRQWLAEHAREWRREKRMPPGDGAVTPARLAARVLHAVGGVSPGRLSKLRSAANRLGTHDPMFRALFPWALERAKERYGVAHDAPGARLRYATSVER